MQFFLLTGEQRQGRQDAADIQSDYIEARPRGYKTFSMLNSIEHEIFPAHKC